MANVLLVSSRAALALDAATRHYGVGLGLFNNYLTEASSSVMFREAGTLSKLYVRVISNDHASIVWRTRVDTGGGPADGNLTVSYGSSETGVKRDDSNSDTIAAGDTVSLRGIATGGTTAIAPIIAFVFTPTSGRTTIYTNQVNINVPNSSVTEFVQLCGRSGVSATEANRRFRALTSGTLKNLRVKGTNQGANTMTFRSRVNGAFGNQTISIAAGGSHGEDTTNTDTIAAGDEIGIAITTGAGMVASSFPLLHCSFLPDNGFQYLTVAEAEVFSNETWFYPVGGDLTGFATESDCTVTAQFAQRLSKLSLYVIANTLDTSATTFTLRKNGVDTALTLSVPAGNTGLFQDLTHTVDVLATDEITYELVAGATGTLTLGWAGMLSQDKRFLLTRF